MKLLTSTSLLLLLAAADALVIDRAPSENHKNHHSTYTDETTGESIKLIIEGYSGASRNVPLNCTYSPTAKFSHRNDVAHNAVVESRDVCSLVTNCAGLLKDAAVFAHMKVWAATTGMCNGLANSVTDLLTENDYAMTKQILTGLGISATFVPISAVAGYYINARLDKMHGSGSDACGQTEPETYAGNAGSAMYMFCLSLKEQHMEKVTTRYAASDAKNEDSENGVGVAGLAKFFIDTQEFTTTEVCSDYGIEWRRDVDAGKAGLVPKKVQF